jgi:maltooligosyltrehalose trehalohydrolase
MPVATFPGRRGWGYDGIYAFAPHEAYGGPEGLRRLVAAAHGEGLAVVLDVVYNHVGPGGGDFVAFGPWFANREGTPWGASLDFSQAGVREWAIQNAELWVREYGIDGLRLDAVFAVHDEEPEHVLTELARRVHAIRADALVISEMNTLDLRPLEEWGHDAMWVDRLHHELHVALTGERYGHWGEFGGTMSGIARELTRSQGPRFVVCAQNHDQVGNQPLGSRLPPRALRVAQAVVLFSPPTPLLFQGEEVATSTPFLFFCDHDDPLFAESSREGRLRELREAGFPDVAPDPSLETTFALSVLDDTQGDLEHRAFVERLLAVRRELPRELHVEADDEARTLLLRRGRATLRLDFDALTVELDA